MVNTPTAPDVNAALDRLGETANRIADERNEFKREVERLRELNAELLRELKSMTFLARAALLCTSVEIARDAKPLLAAADAVIAKAGD